MDTTVHYSALEKSGKLAAGMILKILGRSNAGNTAKMAETVILRFNDLK